MSNGQVILEVGERVAILRLGAESEKIAILNESRMTSLADAVREISKNTSLRGLVITGASPQGFCAGADINVIRSVTDIAFARQLAETGQNIFDLIADLPFPSVAAISGACVGGGCELALACTYRVLVNSPDTRIGLPEIKLGIVPGFGGTQRLPRLIGLPNALDIILKGKVVNAKLANDLGLADYLVSPAADIDVSFKNLIATAEDIVTGKIKPKRKAITLRDRLLTYTQMGRQIVAAKARQEISRTTRGHYPAPLRAIDVAVEGLRTGVRNGLKVEAEALAEMVVTPVGKSLVHVYLLTEEATKRWKSARAEMKEARVCVLGAGTMGSGIAASLLLGGATVSLIDQSPEARERGRKHIEEILRKRKGATVSPADAMAKLEISEKLESVKGCNFLIEAIFENLEVKRKLFKELSPFIDDKMIVASNTSSLPISEFTQDITDAGRVVGLHFFNPAEKMPLLEVVCTKATDDRTIVQSCALGVKIGKYPVVVKEVPGFLVNRILSPYLAEAATLLGEAFSIEDIDQAALDFGMPMGPLRLLDEIGLDVAAHVASIIEASYGKRMSGPSFAEKMAKSGRLGRKSGKGFYRHEGKDAHPDHDIYGVLDLSAPKVLTSAERGELGERLALSLVNEAVRAHDEEVAGAPGRDAAGQIDLAMVMGIGFAPFRGGVLHYAEQLGAAKVLERLEVLAAKHGERFTPWDGIKKRSMQNKSFYQGV